MKSQGTFLVVALQPFITGLSADAELGTELIEGKIPLLAFKDELHLLVHNGNSFPSHRHFPVSMDDIKSVTYVSVWSG